MFRMGHSLALEPDPFSFLYLLDHGASREWLFLSDYIIRLSSNRSFSPFKNNLKETFFMENWSSLLHFFKRTVLKTVDDLIIPADQEPLGKGNHPSLAPFPNLFSSPVIYLCCSEFVSWCFVFH